MAEQDHLEIVNFRKIKVKGPFVRVPLHSIHTSVNASDRPDAVIEWYWNDIRDLGTALIAASEKARKNEQKEKELYIKELDTAVK